MTHHAECRVRVQRRQLEEVGRRGGPDDEVGRRVVKGLLPPRVANLRNGRVVREEAVCVPCSCVNTAKQWQSSSGRRRTVGVLLVSREREHDGLGVVAHAKQVDLAELDACEAAHGRAQQASVVLQEKDAQVLPVVVQCAVDENSLERRWVYGRREVGEYRDCRVLLLRHRERGFPNFEVEADEDGRNPLATTTS